MTLVVRNTFFHLSWHSEDANALGCARRTKSTPPPTTEEVHFFEIIEDRSPSATWVTDCSTAASEDETEIEAEAVVSSGYETDDGSDEIFLRTRDCPTRAMSPNYGAAAPQLSLESKASQRRHPSEPHPTDCSTAASEDESEIEAEAVVSSGYETDDGSDEFFLGTRACPTRAMSPNYGAAAPQLSLESNVSQRRHQIQHQPPVLSWAPVQICPVNTPQVSPCSWTRTDLDLKAQPFKIPMPSSEVGTVLSATTHILVASPCVDTVTSNWGTGGTVATLNVRLARGWQSAVGRRNAAAIAKSALMDITYSSQNVYILGYETQPFEELPEDSGFVFALALVPAAWYGSACWETYQTGCCPRSTKCKWKHPGRDEIQPVRVVIS